MEATVDTRELETKVKDMYRHVAEQPEGKYHFELGRPLAEHLGYPSEVLDRVPDGACESFAGVGYFFDLAQLAEGERVIDLGSGSGMDVFFAAEQVGAPGAVAGIDFTAEQLAKARRIASEFGYSQVEFREGRIERLPAEAESFDSSQLINLAPQSLFPRTCCARAARDRRHRQRAQMKSRSSATPISGLVHRRRGSGGRLPRSHGELGAASQIRDNPYEFISDRARNASAKYGVKSISLLAIKPSN